MAIAILLAAGTGNRFNDSIPKQLIELHGKPVLEHSLEVLYEHDLIDEIILVVSKELSNRVREIAQPYAKKVNQIIEGGNTRSASSFAGLKSIESVDNPKIIIHDSARPFISDEMISACIKALDSYEAVSVAVPSKETTFEVQASEVIRIPSRDSLMRAQTPQGFRLQRIVAGHKRLETDKLFSPTDDCGVIAKYFPNIAIGVIPGSEKNIKITFPEDILTAQAILREENLR